MHCWTTRTTTSSATGARFADGALPLIDAIGDEAFGPRVAKALGAVLPIAYLTGYRKRENAPVTMPLAGSEAASDVTARCWRIYRNGPHRRDRSLDDAVACARVGDLAWCHLTADQIVDRNHRVDVYERHGLRERLSLIEPVPGDGWLSVNLFRIGAQGRFADRELAALEDAAPLLMAIVRRHLRLLDGRSAGPPSVDRLPVLRRALLDRDAGLTERELDVCARLALGMTYDGIAADLGIAVTSAKTYRNRAFDRLDIQFRSQLAPLCWTASSDRAGPTRDASGEHRRGVARRARADGAND